MDLIAAFGTALQPQVVGIVALAARPTASSSARSPG